MSCTFRSMSCSGHWHTMRSRPAGGSGRPLRPARAHAACARQQGPADRQRRHDGAVQPCAAAPTGPGATHSQGNADAGDRPSRQPFAIRTRPRPPPARIPMMLAPPRRPTRRRRRLVCQPRPRRHACPVRARHRVPWATATPATYTWPSHSRLPNAPGRNARPRRVRNRPPDHEEVRLPPREHPPDASGPWPSRVGSGPAAEPPRATARGRRRLGAPRRG